MHSLYPLTGVKVLDLTRLLPGGFCTLMLADLGADVVKVEDPYGGDYSRADDSSQRSVVSSQMSEGSSQTSVASSQTSVASSQMSPVFVALNRGKRSIILDLKSEADHALFLRLVDRADVVIEGFRPGVMRRLRLDAPTLLSRNPRLVYCALTGYGQTGPLTGVAGHDINYIGTNGLLDLIGASDGPPIIPGAQLADLSGAMVAALGILAALLRRATTGQGGVVDTSMTEAAFALVSLPWAQYAATGQAARRSEHLLSGGWACYNVYQAADGRWLALGALEPKFWAAFCQALDHPEWIKLQFEPTVQPWLKAQVAALIAARPAEDWLTLVNGRDIPLTGVNTLAEVGHDPQFIARGVFFEHVTRLTARSPIRLDDLPPAATAPPPGYGEHNALKILAEWE